MLKLCAQRAFRPPDVFIALAMRHLSPLLALLLHAPVSIYYHITHDLNPGTLRRLEFYSAIFAKLTFICPATLDEFQSQLPNSASARKLTWVPQPSEIPVADPARIPDDRSKAIADGSPFRLGLIGRLTREKGAEVMLSFANQCQTSCELHVAGAGPFEEAFVRRQEETGHAVSVMFHGSYDPTERAAFLRTFFSHIDCLVVPSLDEWETLSMAALEALQHGVPAVICRTGGLISFAHKSLGPAPESVVRLVDPSQLPSELEQLAKTNRTPGLETIRDCRKYYEEHFSNLRIEGRWLALTGSGRESSYSPSTSRQKN